MHCPTCNHPDHRVLRTQEREGRVRRTRECLACGRRWFTVEAPEEFFDRAEEIRDAFKTVIGAIGSEE